MYKLGGKEFEYIDDYFNEYNISEKLKPNTAPFFKKYLSSIVVCAKV